MSRVKGQLELPKDTNTENVQLLPAGPALDRDIITPAASTSVALNIGEVTIIRVTSLTQDTYMRWGSDAVTTGNFDFYLLAGVPYDFVVPNETTLDGSPINDVSFLEVAATATVVITQHA